MDHQPKFDVAGEASGILTHSIAAQLNGVSPPPLLRARLDDAARVSYDCFSAGIPLSDDQVTSLINCGSLYRASKHALNARHIQRLIEKRARLGKRPFAAIADALNLLQLRLLAREAALIASEAKDCIDLALQGRIASAVDAVPRVSIDAGEGYSPEQIIDVIIEIAGYLLMLCVLAEARLARAALFAPTGVAVLDNHGGRRSVPLAFPGKTILWNAGEIIKVLGLYDSGRELNAGELATITQFDGLVDHARRCEASWQALYGARLPAIVDHMVDQARLWSRYVRLHVGQVVKGSGRNASLHAFQQTEPLGTFWLACDMAIGWLSYPDRRKRTLRVGVRRNRLRDAIEALWHDNPFRCPTYGDANLFDARRLFYLVRVLVIGDCYASGSRSSTSPVTLQQALARIERAIDTSPSLNPLKSDYEDLGTRRYGKDARGSGTAAALLPSMWVKLHS